VLAALLPGDAILVGEAVLEALLGVSHAPPPDVIEMATNRPVTIVPTSAPPSRSAVNSKALGKPNA